MDFLTLDIGGLGSAVLLGFLFLIFGGIFFVVVMLTFLMLSAIVTNMGLKYKKKIGTKQKNRGIRNVLANGIAPFIMTLIYFYSPATIQPVALVGFLGSVAAITSDKFNSEIGVFNGDPTMIFTFEKVKKGTSGAVTMLGLLSGLFAAYLISLYVMAPPSLSAIPYYNITVCTAKSQCNYLALPLANFSLALLIFSITAGGTIGSIIDSMLGYFEEKGIGNKYTSNFLCGLAGGMFAAAIFFFV